MAAVSSVRENYEDVTYVYCLSDGRVVSAERSRLKIWSSETEDLLLRTVDVPNRGEISCVCQGTVDINLLAVSVYSSIVLYDLRNLSGPNRILEGNTAEINEIGFHNTLPYLYACDDAGNILVHSMEDQQVTKSISGHSNLCTCARFLPHEPWDLVSGGMDCKVIRWNWIHSRSVAESSTLDSEHTSSQMFLNPPMVYCMDLWEDLKCIACGLGNGMVTVYDMKEKSMGIKCCTVLHSAMVVSVCCCENVEDRKEQHCLVSGGNDYTIVVSIYTFQELKILKVIEHYSKINSISVSAGKIFIADQTPTITKYKLLS